MQTSFFGRKIALGSVPRQPEAMGRVLQGCFLEGPGHVHGIHESIEMQIVILGYRWCVLEEGGER